MKQDVKNHDGQHDINDAEFEEEISMDGKMLNKLKLDCAEFIEVSALVKSLDQELKDAKARQTELKMVNIPDLMQGLGMGDTFSIDTGEEIKLGFFVGGSLPKLAYDDSGEPTSESYAARSAAIEELDNIGGSAIIKSQVVVDFSKAEYEKAMQLYDQLGSEGHGVTISQNAHYQSVCSFVKSALNDGDEVDLDVMGLISGMQAKIKAPKKAKKS